MCKSDAPDEEKEEVEKVYSDDSENVSSGSSSSSDSDASGDREESSADEMNAASPPEEKNYVAPTTPDEPDQRPIPVRMASLRARMTKGLFHGESGNQSKWPMAKKPD